MEANNNDSPITQFFENKTVFITGATGFMGKVSGGLRFLVLMMADRSWWRSWCEVQMSRSCCCSSDQRKGWRPSRGSLPSWRVKSSTGEQLTHNGHHFLLTYGIIRIRDENESLLEKVEALNGDIVEDQFGLDEESLEIIKEEVNIIFHSAATVRFDEDLTKSVAMNMRAVSSLVTLARQIKRLVALVDVSTAYCNCDLKFIEEKIYPAPVNPAGIMALCEVRCSQMRTKNLQITIFLDD